MTTIVIPGRPMPKPRVQRVRRIVSKKRIPWEHIEQCALMAWVKKHEKYDASLALLHATFNPGKLSWHMANKLKREGAKAGFPDLFLPVPGYCSHGLFIEMKAKNGTLTPEQKRIFPLLRGMGYQVEVCRSWQAGAKVLCEFLGLDVVIEGGIKIKPERSLKA